MKTLSEIISNALDLAGGTSVAVELTADAATLYALNVFADLELELSMSERGSSAKKFRKSFNFHSRTGTLNFLPKFIRVLTPAGSWEMISIVSDIQDLTVAEKNNRRSILLRVEPNCIRYELSFEPDFSSSAELWGEASPEDFNTLDESASVPEQFAHLAATRTACLLLDDLLLNENAARLLNFIQSRKQTLFARLKKLEQRWTVYITSAGDSLGEAQIRPYNPMEDYGSSFENY